MRRKLNERTNMSESKESETSADSGGLVQDVVMCFRCGWCGQPADENGRVLSLDEINQMSVDWDKAEPVHGYCCQNAQQEREMVQITREMAMDAQDISLEGQWIEW